MDLTPATQPAQVILTGWERFTLNNPGKLKIQTTGSTGATQLNQGPDAGKRWTVQIRVEVSEVDA